MPTCTARPADETSSTIARYRRCGASRVEDHSVGPGRPGPLAGRFDRGRGVRPDEGVRAHRGTEPQPARLQIDDQHLSAVFTRNEADALPDRSPAEHDNTLASLHPGPAHRLDADREWLHQRRDAGALDVDRKHLFLWRNQVLLQAAVEVDTDQPEVVARVRPPDAARVAVPARHQGPQGNELPDGQLITAPGAERCGFARANLMPENTWEL